MPGLRQMYRGLSGGADYAGIQSAFDYPAEIEPSAFRSGNDNGWVNLELPQLSDVYGMVQS